MAELSSPMGSSEKGSSDGCIPPMIPANSEVSLCLFLLVAVAIAVVVAVAVRLLELEPSLTITSPVPAPAPIILALLLPNEAGLSAVEEGGIAPPVLVPVPVDTDATAVLSSLASPSLIRSVELHITAAVLRPTAHSITSITTAVLLLLLLLLLLFLP
jgi:hypothetical protein